MQTERLNLYELRPLVNELNALSIKPHLTKQEELRHSTLLTNIALVKSGVALSEIMETELHDSEQRYGLSEKRMGEPVSRPRRSNMTAEDRATVRAFQQFVRDRQYRDSGTGNPVASTLTGNVGSFVPFSFNAQVFEAIKAYDPLLDDNVVSVYNTSNGRPLQIPIMSDVEENAVMIDENTTVAEQDPAHLGQIILGAYSFRSPKWNFSLEAMQDVEAAGGLVNLFKSFASQRIARGAGQALVQGNSKITGLLPSLLALSNGVAVVASGSAVNTGGSETAANSVGSPDITALFHSVDVAYRMSPKCGWLMNDSTLNYLDGIVTKGGMPLVLWSYNDVVPQPFIMGKPVYISPSMPDIGSQSTPVAFGDLSYWCTRIAVDQSYVKLYKQAPGLAEYGELALCYFARIDGKLAFNDIATGATPPIRLLQNHS